MPRKEDNCDAVQEKYSHIRYPVSSECIHGVGLKMAVGRERLKLEDLVRRESFLSK